MPGLTDRRNTPVNDIALGIAAGAYRGFSSEYKFGHNPTVGAAYETIWQESTLYIYPASATVMTISSDDETDNLAGVGAHSVRLIGLDADYNIITEDLDLHPTDGTLGVTTTKSYFRIHRMYTLTAGSNAGQIGTIYVGTGTLTNGKPANVYALSIEVHNQTSQAVYTVPAGKTAFIKKGFASLSSGKDAEIHFDARIPGEVFSTKFIVHLYQTGFVYDFSTPLLIPEKTDLEVRGAVPQTAGSISAAFEMVLIDNDLLAEDRP